MPTLAGDDCMDVGNAPFYGTFRLQLSGAPYDSTGTVVCGSKIFVDVNAGEYEQELAPGIYSCQMPGQPAFLIGMPNNSSEYTLTEAKYEDVGGMTAVLNGVSYFTNLTQFRADTTNKALAFLNADENGNWGWYVAKGDTASDTGVQYVVNANGVVYTLRE